MKTQKWILGFSVIIAILAGAFAFILELEFDRCIITLRETLLTGHRDFVVNLLIGLCSGAVLAAGIAIINYFQERNTFISEFSDLVEDFYNVCSKLQYLYLRADVDLLAAYYREEYCNQKVLGVSKSNAARDRLLKSYKEKDPKCDEYICFTEDTETIKTELDSVVKSYCAVAFFDFSKIDRILKKGSFIFPKGKKETQIKAVFDYVKKLHSDTGNNMNYWTEFAARDNLIVSLCRFQSTIFDKVERQGNVIFVPPKNKAIADIQELLLKLN